LIKNLFAFETIANPVYMPNDRWKVLHLSAQNTSKLPKFDRQFSTPNNSALNTLFAYFALILSAIKTSCALCDTIYLRPFKMTIFFSYLFARWHLFRHVGYLRHQQQVDLRPFDLESGVRVTCDVGYLCAKFSLPRPLCSRVRPDVRDRQTSDVRQTDVRQKHRIMPPH